jgi:hypothetical protein
MSKLAAGGGPNRLLVSVARQGGRWFALLARTSLAIGAAELALRAG